jgi:hypothetical protein
VSFKIPPGTKWGIARVSAPNQAGSDVEVKIASAGRKCGVAAAKALSLGASPKSFKGKKTVTFVVKAGGKPVKGALVKVAGKKRATNSSGVAKISVGPYPKTKRLKATATKTGYKLASLTLTVRR